MEIGVLGATGTIGSRIVAEAAGRGHRTTAFTRSAERIPTDPGTTRWATVNPRDADHQLTAALADLDVLVNAINAGNGVPDTIANAEAFPATARALLAAMEALPRLRLIVVGGAGSLEVAPGLQVVDTAGFAEGLPDALGVPSEYVHVVRAHRKALELYRLSNRNWTYVSPSAGLVQPGERTGRFRIGGDQLLVREDGTADISAEDLAVAVLDEAEQPRFAQRRFTVGY
ncbi:NAD(P)-dependent oxidoreductase [Pseudonocardia sichuanensis]